MADPENHCGLGVSDRKSSQIGSYKVGNLQELKLLKSVWSMLNHVDIRI